MAHDQIPEQNPDRLRKSMEYLAWYYSCSCVLDVFRENERRYRDGSSTRKPSADIWVVYDELRQDVHRRSRQFWHKRSGYDPLRFPLSVDATAQLYFRIRKRRRDEIESFERELKDAYEKGRPPNLPLFDDED